MPRAGSGMLERPSTGRRRVRTLFLSDIHLGTRGCQADRLLDFLRHYEGETIYLVGDIVDGWQLKSAWYWPQLHNDVVQAPGCSTFPATTTSSFATMTACCTWRPQSRRCWKTRRAYGRRRWRARAVRRQL